MAKGLHKNSLRKVDNPHQWMIDDARRELIQQIKAEVERLKKDVDNSPLATEQIAGYLFALVDVQKILSTFQEQPMKPSVEDAMKELDKKIAKATSSWKGVNVDKMLAECRGYDEQPVCGLESKFKVGDRIQFKGFGHNKYTIAKVEGNRYVDISGNGMDMSYTDANFELVKEQPVCEGLEEEYEQIKQKVCSDCPSHKDDYCGYVKRQLQRKCNYLSDVMYGYELGRQSKPRIVFSKEVFDQYDREQFINAYKPKVCEGLEEEIERYLHSLGVGYGGWVDGMEDDDLRGIARHFAQWGAEHRGGSEGLSCAK